MKFCDYDSRASERADLERRQMVEAATEAERQGHERRSRELKWVLSLAAGLVLFLFLYLMIRKLTN
jgi:hypothetical protein